MRQLFLILFCLGSLSGMSQTDKILLKEARFNTGENNTWATTFYNDESWKTIHTNENWETQGYDGYDGYAWYRMHFVLPSTMRDKSFWKDSLRIFLARIDDADEVYLNGSLIAKHGSFPSDNKGYNTAWNQLREIHIATTSPFLQWDKENLLAIKVYDGGGPGGIFSGDPYINMMDIVDGIKLSANFEPDFSGYNTLVLKNLTYMMVKGTVNFSVTDTDKDSVIQTGSSNITVAPNSPIAFQIKIAPEKRMAVHASFKEFNTGKTVDYDAVNAYILTPLPSKAPRINTADVVGMRPGAPFVFKIAATGERPMQYDVRSLPAGLTLDKVNGVISGTIPTRGTYNVELNVRNRVGAAKKILTIQCGDLLALTPPMGWNSWNCWGLSVSDAKLRSSAQALIDNGLIDHGWTYMNIDDGWEAAARNEQGIIQANEKFPDMSSLGSWLHDRGLRFGIYSSPGARTCGGFLGSYQHELQDATQYAQWGIDYLKYDWCSYERVHDAKDTSLASYKKPYEVMQSALRAQHRDIVYSLCQYGMKNVWEWGATVDGNCWRTTGDIEDTWESLKEIGFNQNKMAPFAKPGRWNDPDMLIVGQVGWGENLHPTRLTPDEQYTHISLWCLLSAPLLIGCDISKIDAFTLNLLTNDEVIAIDQDKLGKEAKQLIVNPTYQVWVKSLADGSRAIGLFNLSETFQKISIPKKELGIISKFRLRDCWRQKDLGLLDNYTVRVPPHGVALLKIK